MKVILDFSVLYIAGSEKGNYSVIVDAEETKLVDCFIALEDQHPKLYEKLLNVNIIKEGIINAMMISGDQLLSSESKVVDNQIIKVVGQSCGG